MSNKKTKINYYYTEIKNFNEYTSLENEYKLAQVNIINLIRIYKFESLKKIFDNFVNNYKNRPRRRRSLISELISETIISINNNKDTNDSWNKNKFRLTHIDDKDTNLYSRTIRDYFRNKYIKN